MIEIKSVQNKNTGLYDVLYYDNGKLIKSKSKFAVGGRTEGLLVTVTLQREAKEKGDAVKIIDI